MPTVVEDNRKKHYLPSSGEVRIRSDYNLEWCVCDKTHSCGSRDATCFLHTQKDCLPLKRYRQKNRNQVNMSAQDNIRT